MNPELLQTLQSIAEVEKDPHFRSKKYVIVDKADRLVDPASDAIPVVLKHPDNVIVVASPTGKSPCPAVGEVRVEQLSKALNMAFKSSRIGSSERGRNGRRKKCLGCSIVVHEGMYIDPFISFGEKGMAALKWPDNFSLEIVGIGQVRILNTCRKTVAFSAEGTRLALKNLLIYDGFKIEREPIGEASVTKPKSRVGAASASGAAAAATTDSSPEEGCSTILAHHAAKVTLQHVRIHGSLSVCLDVKFGSDLEVADSTFNDIHYAVAVGDSKAWLHGCRWPDAQIFGCVANKGILSVKDSSVTSLTGLYVLDTGSADLRGCQFSPLRNVKQGCEDLSICAQASKGGQLSMSDCSMTGYTTAVAVQDSRSKIVLRRCKLLETNHAAVFCQMNSDVSVSDCLISSRYVLVLLYNVSGKVEFHRTTVRPRKIYDDFGIGSFDETAVISTDQQSKKVEHDFDPFRIEYNELGIPWCNAAIGATRESRATFKEERAFVKQFLPDSLSGQETVLRKSCMYCSLQEGPNPKVKFKYCQRCRIVCYCSRECQMAHWKTDHKLVCVNS